MVTEQEINDAYGELLRRKDNLYTAGEKVIEKKAVLEWCKVEAMQNGEIEGKNAEAREAASKSLLAPEYEELENAEKYEREARLGYDLAYIEVERVRALLRLAEIVDKSNV